MSFDPVDPKQSLPDLEEKILQYWKEEDVFKRSVANRGSASADVLNAPQSKEQSNKAAYEYSFYDGPPFATGLPHYGHLLAGTIKDVIPRYQTMRGSMVQRRFGWDCHGLPVENLIEKENDITDKAQIEQMGIGAFNDLCRGSVQRYTAEWRQTVERMGRWVDMDWDYKTMDPEYMESIWWAFSELCKKDLIYEGLKPMHICPRCATPLSNFEVTQGYSDRTDQSVIMTFPLKNDPKTVVLAWTTTPWSLPGNTWLAMSPEISYVRVQEEDIQYVVAEKLVEKVFKGREYEVVGPVKAEELIGQHYEPLFPYFVDKVIPRTEAAGKPETYGERVNKIVYYDDVEVSDADGTGIVHITSCLGGDSYAVAVQEDVDVIHHVRIDGFFSEEVTDFQGVHVKPEGKDPMATDKLVIQWLKDHNRYFSNYTYTHSYPHCWRCDTPLLPYTTSSWFVAVEQIKKTMLAANSETSWMPAHVRDKRFGKWLEDARDWAISRNRYWGAPLPIWRTEDSGSDVEVVGSRDDLMQRKKIRFSKITVLRHAESEGNVIPIYQGDLPGTDLTKNGKKQAKEVGKWLQSGGKTGPAVDIIYCSPLARTVQTAEAIAKETGAKVVIDDRLREVEFGEWEGKTVDFSDPAFLKQCRINKMESGKPESIYHFEGMETWESVQKRVSSFLEETLPKHRSEHVVIVSHADPVINIEHFFTGEDPVKLSHRPYPEKAVPVQYFWDHDKQQQLDLHKDTVDDLVWSSTNKTDVSVELTLVRHGETDWNKDHKAQGHSDIPLNETGKTQAEEAAKKLEGKEFDLVISSDLSRAKETAEIIATHLSITKHVVWPELRERENGDWDGKHIDEIMAEAPGIEGYTGTNFHHLTAPNGESLSLFMQRVEGVASRIQQEYAGKRVLVVSHGGTTRGLKTAIDNLSYKEAALNNIHNAQIAEVTLNSLQKRIPDVLDCWFESGSMPYAQEHYPFEMAHAGMKEPPAFPADFIAEGMDQTRGWFYTLTVLGAALFGKSPFEHCVVNGIVLAEDGKKMSKRLKNYPEPLEVVHKHGADSIRFTLMSSPAVRGEDLRFSEQLVEETVRNVLLPLWNTYSFFVTYANAANFDPNAEHATSTHPLDVWIQSELQDLVNRMTEQLDRYDLSATCAELDETIDALTNWYIRLSRRRFAGKDEDGAQAALATLYDVLLTLSKLLAPFCPYITDAMYLNLVPEAHGSIHLSDWPESKLLSEEQQSLLQKTRMMRLIVRLGNSIRTEAKVKVRQPLASATIALPPSASVQITEEDLALLQQELNVKSIAFAKDPSQLAEVYVQVDARKVGPRLGGRVQEIIAAGKEGAFTEREDGMIVILDEVLSPEEAAIVYRGKEGQDAAADRGIVVSLDTNLTEELTREGQARDIVRAVQRLRKEAGLEFTDNIVLYLEGADAIVEQCKDLICEETRATLGDCNGDDHTIEVGDAKVVLRFEKQ